MPNANPSGFAALDPCVHCGFCLPACPTYSATGDESDSPRGRIVLMRMLEQGTIPADDPALREHLDRCLGCRGCEPVCPSGVGYGQGLEAARARLAEVNGLPFPVRSILGVFRRRWAWRTACAVARGLRGLGVARRMAGSGRLGFGFGMVAASTPAPAPKTKPTGPGAPAPEPRGTVALFRGCVMDGLFDHVHAATARTLTANGYRVIEVADQVCCGALHDHAGDRAGAERLSRQNRAAFLDQADYVVVNSAGCGAWLKHDESLGGSRVRDVSELLAAAGPRLGAPLDLTVAYDAPCHLQHAQRVHAEPLGMLSAIPGLAVQLLSGFDRCCGSAGLYGVLQPELSRDVLAEKIRTIAAATPVPDIVATGNPGCLMQIGAGLLAAKLPVTVAHPVELLDWSYRRAGYY